MAHLSSLIKKDSDFIEALGKTERKLELETSGLRARGMVTKAQELVSASVSRLDTQRLAAMERIKAHSMEMAEIRSSTTKAASVPAMLAALLCAAFALSLELVPALLFSVLHSARHEECRVEHHEKLAATLIQETERTEISTELVQNGNLLDALLRQAYSVPAQTKIKVKDFATQNRIGNLKACAIFKEAETLGAISKTRLGYLTTPNH